MLKIIDVLIKQFQFTIQMHQKHLNNRKQGQHLKTISAVLYLYLLSLSIKEIIFNRILHFVSG